MAVPEDKPEQIRLRKKVCRILLFSLAGLILAIAVYSSIRRASSRFTRDFMSPFLKIVNMTEDQAFRSAQMLKPKRKLAAEVQLLERRNLILNAELLSLKKLQEENRILRSTLKLPQKSGFHPVLAEITGRTAPLWRERFVINCGKADGICAGDCAAAPDSAGRLTIAGRVMEVSEHTAVIFTIYSEECRFSVSLPDGSAGGMEMEADKKALCIKYLPVSGDYQPGTQVLTSGISGGIPGGLPVGTILSRGKDAPPAVIRDQLYAEVLVQPSLRIDSVRTVVVFATGARVK